MPSQPISPRRPDDLDREAPLALVLVDDRGDLVDHEVADRRAQQGVLGREVEVHARERSTGPAARVTEC